MEKFKMFPHLHPLLEIITYINLTIRIVVLYYTVLHRKWRQIQGLELYMQLIAIEMKYFHNHKPIKNFEKRFKILYYIKYSIVCIFHIATFIINVQATMETFSWYNLIYQIYNAAVLNIIHIVMLKFYEMILRIYHLMFHITKQMDNIHKKLNTTNRNLKLLTAEVQTIWKIHGELCVILEKILRLYQFQLIVNRIFCAINNVIIMYYGYVFLFFYHMKVKTIILGAIAYSIFTVDLYLNDFLYEMIGKCFKDLLLIMKKFNLKKGNV